MRGRRWRSGGGEVEGEGKGEGRGGKRWGRRGGRGREEVFASDAGMSRERLAWGIVREGKWGGYRLVSGKENIGGL